jgi:ribokinase
MAPRIVVVGSCSTDLFVRAARIPAVGETVIGGTFHTSGGGKGANQAVAAARAGARVEFVGRVGADDFGRSVRAGLSGFGVGIAHLARDPQAPTGVAFIFVGGRGENSIAVASGANLRVGPGDVRRAQPLFRAGAILLLQLEIGLAAVRAAGALARRRGLQVILNPAPARPLPDALMRQVHLLTPNEHEAEALTGIRIAGAASAARAAARLRRRGVKTVIITLGPAGVFVSAPSVQGLFPGFRVRAVDTTGAGDVFNGALAAALAEGRELPAAVRFGQAAAALSVTRLGTQSSIPARTEIDRLLRRS